MSEQAEATSSTDIASCPQASVDVENGTQIDKGDNNESPKFQRRRFYARQIACIFLIGTSVVLGISGTVIYFTVFKTEDATLSSPDSLQGGEVFQTEDATLSSPDSLQGGEVFQTEDGTLSSPDSLQGGEDSEYVCPQNWTLHGKKCFLFSRTPVSEANSQEYCANEGGVPMTPGMETRYIRKLMAAEMGSVIGCCLYDLSLRSNDSSIVENIQGEIANSLSLPYDTVWRVMDEFWLLVNAVSQSNDDELVPGPNSVSSENSPSNARQPISGQHSVTSSPTTTSVYTLPSSFYPWSSWGTATFRMFTGPLTSFGPSTVTPIPPNGFWLGAGIQHNHGEPSPENSPDKSPQRNDAMAQPSSLNVAKTELLEVFCRKFESELKKWRQTDCDGSNVQICERNAAVVKQRNTTTGTGS